MWATERKQAGWPFVSRVNPKQHVYSGLVPFLVGHPCLAGGTVLKAQGTKVSSVQSTQIL